MDNDFKSTGNNDWIHFIFPILPFVPVSLLVICSYCGRRADDRSSVNHEFTVNNIHQNDDIENNTIEIENEPRSTTITTTATAAHQVEANESELKNQRREYILTNVIWKTVLSTSTLLPHESYSSIRSNTDKDNTSHCIDSSTISVGQDHDCESIAFPIQLPIDVENCLARKEGSSQEIRRFQRQKKVNIPNKKKKGNIFVSSLRSSIREIFNIHSERSASSTLYSPKQCPICLEAYKVGDEIAWSKNDNCQHAYHLDCILDWLMENEQCPMCRAPYLVE